MPSSCELCRRESSHVELDLEQAARQGLSLTCLLVEPCSGTRDVERGEIWAAEGTAGGIAGRHIDACELLAARCMASHAACSPMRAQEGSACMPSHAVR